MSLALSTLLYEWRRYMAAVMALALSGLLVLAMTGVFMGIGKGFTAQIDRSSADVLILAPGAKALGQGPSGVPRRFIPLVYRHPDVVEVRALAGSGGQFQSIKEYDPTETPAERARRGAPRAEQVAVNVIDTTPGAVTIPTDYSEELIDALRQPYSVAVDESAMGRLGVKLGDRALYNGQTVRVVGITRGYPNLIVATLVMSRDTLRTLGGTSDSSPRVGPLMVRLADPERAEVVAAELNDMGEGSYRAWTRSELALANQGAILENGVLVVILGGVTVMGIVIGVAITWQTLQGAVLANIKEFASLRALGASMGSLQRIVVELSFWVGVTGILAAGVLTWLVSLLAGANGILLYFPLLLILIVSGGLIAIAMLSGFLSLGILKKSQPADLLR
ncbi:ABC transporter permease [Brevundimonas sp.]|uniref:ABC transporter permease n=1 Tax=Brevundimonas sp. TaxID=1871086 RepID=UPI0035625175